MTNKITWGNDVGDILTAIENAQSAITDALDELRGIGELMDVFGMIEDAQDELEKLKDKNESYMSGEYQQQLAEMTRDYYREVM